MHMHSILFRHSFNSSLNKRRLHTLSFNFSPLVLCGIEAVHVYSLLFYAGLKQCMYIGFCSMRD